MNPKKLLHSPVQSTDADIRGSWHALRRAARNAHALARATGTPLYVLRAGRVVNLNPSTKRRRQP